MRTDDVMRYELWGVLVNGTSLASPFYMSRDVARRAAASWRDGSRKARPVRVTAFVRVPAKAKPVTA
jgi:hypothetical protein